MPVLPDGTYVDDDEYAAQLARLGGTPIPTSGTFTLPGTDAPTKWGLQDGTFSLSSGDYPSLFGEAQFGTQAPFLESYQAGMKQDIPIGHCYVTG